MLTVALRLKIPQVAELLGVHPDTVDALIARGVFVPQRGPGRKSHRYIPADEVAAYVEALPRGEAYAAAVLRERRRERGK